MPLDSMLAPKSRPEPVILADRHAGVVIGYVEDVAVTGQWRLARSRCILRIDGGYPTNTLTGITAPYHVGMALRNMVWLDRETYNRLYDSSPNAFLSSDDLRLVRYMLGEK